MDYPSNSNKSKEENRQTVAPVVSEPAVVRKSRKKNKLLHMIFAQDFVDIKKGLVTEWIAPKIKDLSWSLIQAGIDTVQNAMKMMVYEDYKPVDRAKLPAERCSYSNYYPQQNRPVPTMTSEVNYDEFIYKTFGEADAVLTELKNLISRSRCATVLDLYNLSKVATSNYTLQDWGWTDLSFAEVKQSQDGYIIALPKARSLPR